MDETPQTNEAASPAPLVEKPPRGALLRELLETLAIALLIFLVVQTVWRNFRVDGSSMEPNIHDAQYIVVDRLVYRSGFPIDQLRARLGSRTLAGRLLNHVFHAPQRGDVIVFAPPSNPSRDYIKRVIGIPGDMVEMRQGRVSVNGRPLTEPYMLPAGGNWGPQRVGAGEFFVMGDNRGSSSDSRFFGMLPRKNIIGKAWLSYWPPQRLGFIRHYDLSVQLR